MSGMFMLLQKLPCDGKRQIHLSTLSKLTTGNAFRVQWYQNHTNFHCYQQIQSFLITLYNGPSNKFIFRATHGNSIVCNIFPALKMTQETSDILTK
jgi:hypothetical protein